MVVGLHDVDLDLLFARREEGALLDAELWARRGELAAMKRVRWEVCPACKASGRSRWRTVQQPGEEGR